MDIQRIREFITISETGSFTAAAKQLGIPSNVLSTRFRNFEETLGVTLILRSSRRLSLTNAGNMFLPYAREFLGHYEQACSSIRQIKDETTRSLRIQLCSHCMVSELGIYLDLFNRRYPRLCLDLFDDNRGLVRDGLISGDIDIAVILGRADAFSDISGRIQITCRPHLDIYVPNDHRLSNRTQVSFPELADETFVLYPRFPEPLLHDLQLSYLKQAGIPYQIYGGYSTPLFYDLFVPIGKGIMFYNWEARVPPNSTQLTITDSGYETYMYLLYQADTQNRTALDFINGYRSFLQMPGRNLNPARQDALPPAEGRGNTYFQEEK